MEISRSTRQDIGRAGVIGEDNNRLLMYLIFTSRKRENPLHVISLGSSGIGKTHLQEKVSALIPDEDKMESTSLTAAAIYYFGRHDLRHKLVLIEDFDGAIGMSSAASMMPSSTSKNTCSGTTSNGNIADWDALRRSKNGSRAFPVQLTSRAARWMRKGCQGLMIP